METRLNGLAPAWSRLPSLDGWRAVSIIMVLGGHAGRLMAGAEMPVFNAIFDGNLGVCFFFVISGFLITWLLLREFEQHGKIRLGNFYVRRFLRILPVYFAFVLVLLGLRLWTPFRETAAGWLGMLTFTRNFTEGSGASAHFWSLSVEEQFYLVWPGLLVLLAGRGLRTKLAVLAAPVCIAPLFRLGTFIFHFEHDRLFGGMNGIHLKPRFLEAFFLKYSFFCYFDTLALGCLGAILFADQPAAVAAFFQRRRRAVCSGALFLIAAPQVLGSAYFYGVVKVALVMFAPTLQTAGFLLLLGQSLVEPGWGAYRWLNWKWVGWMGMLSYSLYIWQQIFWLRAWRGGEFTGSRTDPLWAWCWLIPVFAAASLSFYGLERPLFRLRSRFRTP